jgi:hypothetical protein
MLRNLLELVLRLFARRLDQGQRAKTLGEPDQSRLIVRQEGAAYRLSSSARGFSNSPGAQKLALLGAFMTLIAAGILATVAGVQLLYPDRAGWLVWLSATPVAGFIGFLGWVAIGWARAAAYETVEIDCDSHSIRLRRLAPAKADIEIPVADIKSVLVTDQLFVSLELLVVTRDSTVHRMMSGLSKRELDDAAAIISSFVPLGAKE